MISSRTGKRLCLVMGLLAIVAYGCGGDDDSTDNGPPIVTCVHMGNAAFVGTEDVTVASGICPSSSDLAVTFTIAQAAGSCDFTLQSSLLPVGTTFHGSASGSDLTWTGSYPSASGTVTITGVDATFATTASETTLTGNFTWRYSGNTQCTGTTTFDLVKQQPAAAAHP
jgi:hypothetical protein